MTMRHVARIVDDNRTSRRGLSFAVGVEERCFGHPKPRDRVDKLELRPRLIGMEIVIG